MNLTFAALRAANVKRQSEVFKPLYEQRPIEYARGALVNAGNVSSLCKTKRQDDHEIDAAKIGGEIADTIIYLDLLAARLNINLEDAIRAKFNATSRRRLCDLTI